MRVVRRILLAVIALCGMIWAGLVAYAYWPGPAEVPARQLAGAEDRFATVDGLELRYRAYGEQAPGRPNLVLLHGFANSLQSFRLLAPLIAGDYYVVALDMPGFGLSAKPADHDYHNAAQAKMVADFAQAIGLGDYVVGGHSLGGTIALHVAVSDPHVTGLVLMNPGIITTGVPAITQYLFWPVPRVMAKTFGTAGFRESFLRRSYINPAIVTPQVLSDMMLAPRSEGYLAGMTSMMGQYEEGQEIAMLARVKVPTLITWGEQDRSKSMAELAELRRRLPAARVVTAPASGHYVQEEAPEVVAAALKDAVGMWNPAQKASNTLHLHNPGSHSMDLHPVG
jgi:pimeloyl-ACP methyl ester carboxylesterase